MKTIYRRALVFSMTLFFSSGYSNAQNQILADSLIGVLNNAQNSDSAKLVILYEITKKSSSPEDKIKYASRLLEEALNLNSIRYIQSAYTCLGTGYRLKGDLKKSLDYLFRSAAMAESNDYLTRLGEAYGEISTTYAKNQDLTNSLIFENKAIDIFSKSGDYQQLAILILNAGYHYYQLGLLDSALTYSIRAEQFFDSTGLIIGKAYAIGNKALIYAKLGNLEKAENDLKISVELLGLLGDNYAISDYLNQLSSIYYQQEETSKAIKTAEQGLAIAKIGDFKEQIRDACYLLYQAHHDLAFYQEALEYQTEYFAFKDSITNAETIRKMADLRTEFEVGQKQAEVDLVTAQQKTERIIMVGIAILALVMVGLALVIYKYYRSKARINKELETLNQTKDKFFSIISHDLRGPVSSFMGISRMIKFLVEHKETEQLLEVADDIDHSVERLSELLDNLLTWAMQQQGHFPNVPEKLHLRGMASELTGTLATMAKGKNIELTSTIEEDITLWADKNTTMTILRNLVNNALKFTPEGGSVTISADQKGDFAEVSVSDTGVGIPQEKLDKLFKLQDKKSTYGTSGEKGLGLGLQLVYEFIEMNHGSITVESEEGQGTTFRVQLPLFEGVGVGV